MRTPGLPPHERHALVAGGMVHRRPLPCDVCGAPMQPGDMVMCGDGYQRIYGEFVLGEPPGHDDLHEDNWPTAHAACAAEE